MCATDCMLVGLDWAKPMMLFILHVTCSCIPMHTFFLFNISWYTWIFFWDFYDCLSLPLSSVCVNLCLWYPNASLLHYGILFVMGHSLRLILLLHPFDSMMRMLERPSMRTFLDKAFILNAKSSWRTSPTLAYPLSFIVGVGSHCVTSRSHVHLCWFRSFTSTCMDLIIQYLISLLAFEVRALLSHRRLLRMCSMSPG